MRFRWQSLAALALVPMGVALADYGDSTGAPPPAPTNVERSAEHLSLIESSERSLDQITRGMHELAIGMQNARRSEDMILATCLAGVLEDLRALQRQAIQALQVMHETQTVEAARTTGALVADKNEKLASLLEEAAACEGGEQTKRSSSNSDVTSQVDPAFDLGSSTPGIIDMIEPPVIAPPPKTPPLIDVMEPGTDVPLPPTASPMR